MLRGIARAIRAALRGLAKVGIGVVAGLTGWQPAEIDDVPEAAPESPQATRPAEIIHQAAQAVLGGGEMPDVERLSERQREWVGELRGVDWQILGQCRPERIARHLDPKDDLDLIPGLHRLDGKSQRIGVIHPLPRQAPRPVAMEVDDSISGYEPQSARLA